MTKKSEDLADLETIIKRVTWWLRLTPEKMMEHIREHRMDAFHSIPNPRNGGMLIVGQEVTDLFWKIARRYLTAHPPEKLRTSLKIFVEELRTQFSQLFIAKESKIDQDAADQWITLAYATTAQKHQASTHYIPCAIISSDKVAQFRVGPVTFLHESEFSRLHGGELEKLRDTISARHRKHVEEAISKGFPAEKTATPEQSAKLGHRLTESLLDSFKRYSWFAAVDIDPAHEEVSYERALFVTKGALNIIKMLLGSYHTDRLRTADDYGHLGKASTLTRDAKGELHTSHSNTPIDNIVGDQWLEVLTSGKHLERLATVLTRCSKFEDPPPLCARLIDALAWFGDAVAEKSPAAKIVKFVNAIERICGTGKELTSEGKERGVTGIVLTRSAILYSVISGTSFSASKKEIEDIYECRSNLVHGSASPFDDKVAAQVHKTDQITNTVLFAAVEYYATLGLENVSVRPAPL